MVGTGYVGLVVGAGLADAGNQVTCIDRDGSRIRDLCSAQMPLAEPGLKQLIEHNVGLKRLSFSNELDKPVADADVVMIAVGTPSSDGGLELSAIQEAAAAIGRALRGFTVVVNKSTVPPGTSATLETWIEAQTDQPFAVASNPEFLKEGNAVDDFLHPDRVIVGTTNERAVSVLRELYAPFLRISDRLMLMDPTSAELTKLAANAMLATRISLMNEIALLATKVGANIDSVRRGVGSDSRIGPRYLFAGPGYGGSCLPKDVAGLLACGTEHDLPMSVVSGAQRTNQRQRMMVPAQLRKAFGGKLDNKNVAIWGLSYKPQTDDVRNSPALDAIDALLAEGAAVTAFDPVAMSNAADVFGRRVTFADDKYAAADGTDALVLMTEWREFRRPDFARLHQAMRTPLLFDARNQWDVETAQRHGLQLWGIGEYRRAI